MERQFNPSSPERCKEFSVGWQELRSRRAILALAAAGVSFFLCCGTIHFLIGDPLYLHAAQRTEKLQILAKESALTNVAAFGSSHVHNGFDPREFDAVANANGFNFRALNGALEGGSQGEQFVLAKEYLRLSAAANTTSSTKLILLEANAGANFTNDHLIHPRAINIYDAEVSALVGNFALGTASMQRMVGRASYTIAAAGLHHLNVGMLASLLFPASNDTALFARQTDSDRRGLLIEPYSASEAKGVADLINQRPGQIDKQAAEILPGHREQIRRLAQHYAGRPLNFAYLVSPLLKDMYTKEIYPDCIVVEERSVPIIDVSLPWKYPALYDGAMWRDSAHLNEAGAGLYTRLLTQALIQTFQHSGSHQRCEGFLNVVR